MTTRFETMTFKIDKDTARYLEKVLDDIYKTQYKVPEGVNTFVDCIYNAIRHGCWKHNKITTTFRISDQETHEICSDCNPKKFLEFKRKYKVIR
jgi:hypothetical protein